MQIGDIHVSATKLDAAKKTKNAYKMARKLLPDFFTPEELASCTSVPPKPGGIKRSLANPDKMRALLGVLTYLWEV